MTAAAHARQKPGTMPWARWRANSAASVKSAARALKGHRTTIRSAILQTGALSAATASAFTINTTTGLAVLCPALFVLNWLLTDPPAGGR